MNRTYRLVWNHALRVLQVASELAPGQASGSMAANTEPRPIRRRLLALGCLAACTGPIDSAMAACSPVNPTDGATVTCSGVANPLAPSYASNPDNLTVNVNAGGSIGVLQGIGGTAMSLTGNGTTLNNAGTIDPALFGLLSLLSSGTVIGNPNLGTLIPGSIVKVGNQGTMNGTTGLLGLNLPDLTGMALAVRNGGGGTTTINNSGTIGSTALLGVSMLGSDAPVVAAYGGSRINFTNTGFITGRTAFESSAAGNTFINAGIISGSVSMGTNSTNTFTAVTGSDVNAGGSPGQNLLGVLGTNLNFAPTGQIDGGAGGSNTLVLQNVMTGPGSDASGTGFASSATYVNFQNLIVNSGTWSLKGALVGGSTTLNGGVAQFDGDANFGSARSITSNGGGIAARVDGVTLSRSIQLNAGGLTATGSNNFTLAGQLSGSGPLTKSDASTVTLTTSELYTGDTIINGGTLALSGAGALPSNASVNLQGSGTLDISGASGNRTIGSVTGTSGTAITLGARALTFGDSTNTTFGGTIGGAGGIIKQGSGVTTLSGANIYTGGTAINTGTLAIGVGGSLAGSGTVALSSPGGAFDISGAGANQTIGALSGVAGSQVALGTYTLTLGDASNTTFGGTISGTGGIVKQGAGTFTLSGTHTYTGGTTVNAGTLALGSGGSLAPTGAVLLAVPGSTLDLSAAGAQSIGPLFGVAGSSVLLGAGALTIAPSGSSSFGGTIGGTAGIVINGTGTETFTGTNIYIGGTSIQSGTLALGSGGALAGSGALTLASGGTFDISAGGNQTIGALAGAGGTIKLGASMLDVSGSGGGSFDGVIQGTGRVTNTGNALVLNGVNTYTGLTTVQGGSLTVGDAAHSGARVAGDVTVASGASLGGFGTVGGSVTVQGGGHLAPGAPTGTFTVNSDLTLAQGSVLDFSFGAPGPNFTTFGTGHNVAVAGNLAINGATLNPIDAGGFGPGLYNLFAYGGALTETNGGVVPPSGFTIQNLTASKQINLINTNGITLTFWNANGLASGTQMGGGSGTWSVAQPNWTDARGSVTSTRSPADAFSIFGGAGGTVTVDDMGGTHPVITKGMQFASDGYHLTGDSLTLAAASAGAFSEIRVGDGSGASAGWTTTIANSLIGVGLNKTGAGTLVLNGVNVYNQGTMLTAGTLSVGSDASLGINGAAIDFEGGVLRITGTSYQSTNRAITFGDAGGGFDIADATNIFTVNQSLGGTGSLVKLGAGTLVLSGANSYTGGTTISAGTLRGDTTSLQGTITNHALLQFEQAIDGTYNGSMSGTGTLVKSGVGTLVLAGANSYTGGTIIRAGTLQGDTTSLVGDITNDAALVFDQSADGSFGGGISGSGSVTKLGAGTVTLTGANAYTGGTTVAAGALQGTTTSLQGAISDNASLIFNQSTDGVFAGDISGSGSLAKTGAGKVILSGTNTYGGGTTISGGALQGSTSSLQGVITDNAALIFDQAAAGTFSGVISGSGSVTKQGAGTVTLTGANAYTGGTTVAAGALAGTTTSLQGDIVDNASLVFDQAMAGTYAGRLSGTGSVTKSGAGVLTLAGVSTYSGGTTIAEGTLRGNTSNLQGAIADGAALVFDQAADGIFSGTLSAGGSLMKTGAGTLVINTTNTFTGTTTVSQGALVVGDDNHPTASLAGPMTVSSGAVLAGVGSVGSLDAFGAVKPGNSPGTLTATGNAVFHPGSSLEVWAAPDGQVGRLAVNGSVSILGGSVLTLAQAGTYVPLTHYTILTADGGITGTFAGVTSNLLFLTPALSYGGNAVTLSLQRNDVRFASVAQTRSQLAAAVALDRLSVASPVYVGMLGLDTATARHALDQLSGEVHASVTTALADDSRYVRDAINNHLLGTSAGGQQVEGVTNAGTSVWTSGWGHWGHHDGDGNVHTMSANGSGILLGADLPVDAFRVGGVIGHGQGSLSVDDVASTGHTDSSYAGLYAGWDLGAWRVRGGLAYAWQSIDVTRHIAFGPYTGTAQSSYDAHTGQAYIDAGYTFQLGAGSVEPYINLSEVHVWTDAFTEQGASAALAIQGSSANVSNGLLGVRGTLDLGPGGLHAYAGAGWQHAWGDRLPERQQRFAAGADTFTIDGLPVADNAGVVDLGLRFPIGRMVTADFGYHGQFASGAKDQAARFTLNVAF